MRNRFQDRFGTRSARFLLLSAAMLSGCTVGPNYHRPAVPTPPAFHGPDQSQQAASQTASFADLPWWEVFHDPQLQDLIRTALKQNYDLQLAVERVTAARAQVGIARSNQFPQVSLDPTFSGGKTDENIKSNIFSLAGDAVFQVDLFGRYRRETEAARAQLLGTQDAQQTVVLTLVSDVASDYFLLRVLGAEQLSPGRFCFAPVAPEEIDLEDDVTSKRKDVGLDILIGLSATEFGVERNHRKLV